MTEAMKKQMEGCAPVVRTYHSTCDGEVLLSLDDHFWIRKAGQKTLTQYLPLSEEILAKSRLVALTTAESRREYPKDIESTKQVDVSVLKVTNGNVLCAGSEISGTWVAVGMENKQICIFNESGLVGVYLCHKRPTCINLVEQSEGLDIVVADKSGDVYKGRIEKLSNKHVLRTGSLLLGHVSMLLDVAIVPKAGVILTAERDEKVRVSEYPVCESIVTFLTGHTGMVPLVKALPAEAHHAVTLSGDATMRVWDYLSGACTACFNYNNDKDQDIMAASDESTLPRLFDSRNRAVLVGAYSPATQSSVKIYEVQDSQIKLLKDIRAPEGCNTIIAARLFAPVQALIISANVEFPNKNDGTEEAHRREYDPDRLAATGIVVEEIDFRSGLRKVVDDVALSLPSTVMFDTLSDLRKVVDQQNLEAYEENKKGWQDKKRRERDRQKERKRQKFHHASKES
eukprot:Clim_evm49s156 gene=Clim_evmTU49s156